MYVCMHVYMYVCVYLCMCGFCSVWACMLIWYIFSCNWVDTRWQQYSSHLHTSSTPNTKNGTYITIWTEHTCVWVLWCVVVCVVCGFCNVWACVYVCVGGACMCGVGKWVCMGVCVCVSGGVCVGMFCNVCVLVTCVLYPDRFFRAFSSVVWPLDPYHQALFV